MEWSETAYTYIVIIFDNLDLHSCYFSKGMQLSLAEALVYLR